MRKIFTMAVIALSLNVFGQVTTNGLVGYWPFNGNANDESGNNHHGVVNGATLTADRFGNANNAYYFNGYSSYISINPSAITYNNGLTISLWVKVESSYSNVQFFVSKGDDDVAGHFHLGYNESAGTFIGDINGLYNGLNSASSFQFQQTRWRHIVFTSNNQSLKMYIDGNLNSTYTNPESIATLSSQILFGKHSKSLYPYYTSGSLDDIRIYNRALSEQEVTEMYNESVLSVEITPTNNNTSTNNNVQFIASANKPIQAYQWQSNHANFGWTDVPENSTYSGANTPTLTVNNVQLANHLQPFRVIATYGISKDTSDIARIVIADTCILTVTDTLVINAILTGLQAPNNTNTIKIYPNPAKDHITIHYGNYADMIGYTVKITNTLGATIFETNINQQTSYIGLNNWSEKGVYFVHLIDTQNITIDIKKIILQ
jgi:hypothetical protein